MKSFKPRNILVTLVITACLLTALFVIQSVNGQNADLKASRDQYQTAVVQANLAVTQQAQIIADTESSISTMQAQGHDLCMTFLTAPVSDGAVIDVTRLAECQEFVSDAEYQQALDHQVLRANGKLTVFLSDSPFYVVANGQQIFATQGSGSYGLTFDPLSGVESFQIGDCGEELPTVPEGTFLIYPCDF